MELMDLKRIETNTKNQIREAKVQIEIAQVLLDWAEIQIAHIEQETKTEPKDD